MHDRPEAFIFMKVGNHAGETWDQILERKTREHRDTGMTLWGYGGTTCHPIHQVQPFAKRHVERRGGIYLCMEPINSNADPDLFPAREYSRDGIVWEPIPDGISVTGSRYALILDEITPEDLEVHLEEYQVGAGRSRGKPACDYVQGRVDKGCFELSAKAYVPDREVKPRKIQYSARLIEPFAVLLR